MNKKNLFIELNICTYIFCLDLIYIHSTFYVKPYAYAERKIYSRESKKKKILSSPLHSIDGGWSSFIQLSGNLYRFNRTTTTSMTPLDSIPHTLSLNAKPNEARVNIFQFDK